MPRARRRRTSNSIRDHLGVDQFALYGESYGTELAQVYAAAHPDRLTGLILDGAVDLTVGANEFWSRAALSFDRTLSATFDACRTDVFCAADAVGLAQPYERLLIDLSADDSYIAYADPDGVVRPHPLTKHAVESVVASLLYEPQGRALIQRAVAAAANGDRVPIAKLAELSGSEIDSSISSFAYHAVTCADYRVSPTADVADVDSVMAAGEKSGALRARTDEVYLTQLPCLYWPEQPADALRPGPLTTLDVPLIVLAAELDPITPIEFGRAIAERAREGYLVETSGGPHVTFGGGNRCVDRVVNRFLLEGQVPSSPTVKCRGEVTEGYYPLTELAGSGFDDAMDLMFAIEAELFSEPRYFYWDGTADLRSGCRFGGTVTVEATELVESYMFDECAYARDLEITGDGSYDGELFRLEVEIPDGSLTYESTSATTTVKGTFRGRPVDQRE